MKVLVTGGLGKLGQYVVQALLDESDGRARHQVTVLDQVAGPERGEVRYLRGDIRDLGQVFGAASGADAIIHLAAIHKPDIAPDDVVFSTNVLGTFNVHEAAWRLGIPRVISTSSEAALGWDYRKREFAPDYLPIDEDHPVRPQDPYGLSKVVGETIARSYADRGLDTIVLRPPWVVVPEALDQLREAGGRQAGRFTFGSYIDVRDLAEAYRLALDAPVSGFVVLFVVADDTSIAEPLSTFMPRLLPEIGDMAREITGTRPAVLNSRAKQVLGWQPRRSWRQPAGQPE